jgi:hypothetical protein
VTGLRFVQIAVLAPAASGLAWLATWPWRWPRRILAGLLAVAWVAAAWGVVWLTYSGRAPAWRGLAPDLLGATLAAIVGVTILIALLGLERRPPADLPLLVAGLAASGSAVAIAAYTDSLVLLAMAIPIPTLAAGALALGKDGDLRGMAGLALADLLVLAGLTVAFDRTDTTSIAASPGLAAGLMLAGAALKAGAVPGLATSRLVGSLAAPLAAAIRGQALVVAAVAGLVVAGAEEMLPLAVAAVAASLLAGVVALAARRRSTILAAVLAAAAAVSFAALGLGGGVGARAFLVLAPPFLLAGAAAEALWGVPAERPEAVPREASRPRRALGAVAVLAGGVLLGSLAGLPPGGGFPGTWLTAALAGERGTGAPGYLLLEGGLLLALAAAFAGSVPLLRSMRPRVGPAIAAAGAALLLLYVGTQPVRLGVGWWLRIEDELALPTVVPAAGGPELAPIGGFHLVLALAPAAVVVLLLVAAGRGVRPARFARIPAASRMDAGARLQRLRSLSARVWSRPVLLAAIGLLVVATVALAVRLLILGIGSGFL